MSGAQGRITSGHDPEMTLYDPEQANQAQRRAADPLVSAWVGASAGSGKTKVLTDRVLRLLLPRPDGQPGSDPEKILCLTFTKAAAGEMALRIGRELGHWAVLPEPELAVTLERLLGRTPTPEILGAARQLFARVIDAPGGIRILTIHSFCKSILSRFPLEAGLSPGFEVIEEGEARRLLDAATAQTLENSGADDTLAEAVDLLAAEQTREQFRALVEDLVQERLQLERLAQRCWGAEGIYTEICRFLGLPPGQDAVHVILDACANGSFEEEALRRVAQALAAGGGKSDLKRARTLSSWLDATPQARVAQFDSYREVFFTKEGDLRKALASKAAKARDPECEPPLTREAQRLAAVQERVKSAECAGLTRALLRIGLDIINIYRSLKEKRGVLDYDDLVTRTLNLLQGRSMGMEEADAAPWIMYKLDQGIDHVLIDEAQDTNPEQWEIVAALCSEFFAGEGAHAGLSRTVFSVGDAKQSIFSFQRAAPDRFARMRSHFETLARAAGAGWERVEMDVSFRSGRSVLRLVDAVFAEDSARSGVSESPVRHLSSRQGQAGLVELWPVFGPPEGENAQEIEGLWTPPVAARDTASGAARLAGRIAATIRGWIDSGEPLPSRGRAVRAGDVLILVRSRTAFVGQLVRALKLRGVSVSGVDRMILTEQLAVRDLLALAAFALLPEDDLSLACALKSPLVGIGEEALFTLCHGRKASLWARLRADPEHEKTANWLNALIVRAASGRPYEFFTGILQEPCPADDSGLKAIRARLGEEALDPLDELLNAALDSDRTGSGTLRGFLKALSRPGGGIKRQTEDFADCVRIMTVHGAKGLQAPIVFLPDTLRGPSSRRTSRLLWPDRTGAPTPLWTPRGELAPKPYRAAFDILRARDDEEYRRLLYVALTRAEDRLYVCGHRGGREPLDESWYHYIARAFRALENVQESVFEGYKASIAEEGPGILFRISDPQTESPDRIRAERGEAALEVGDSRWLRRPPPPEPSPPRPLTPSRPADPDPAVLSPLAEGDAQRFRRGVLTHRLLQIIPDFPRAKRAEAMERFLDTQAADLPAELREDIGCEVLKILESQEFAPLFGPGSLAEVPVTGLLGDGRLVSGQIDRLLVTEKQIVIVDYKTNRPPPQDPKDVPLAYRNQLRAYHDTLARIWPGREIRTFLLWTDGPRMMEVAL